MAQILYETLITVRLSLCNSVADTHATPIENMPIMINFFFVRI